MTWDWTAKGACRANPALFDDRLDLPGAVRELEEARSERHTLAIGLCLGVPGKDRDNPDVPACQVLDQCRALLAGGASGLEGIVAGRLIPSRTTPFTPLPPGDPRHGTATGYANHRCRCPGPDGCTEAHRAYEASRRGRKATA